MNHGPRILLPLIFFSALLLPSLVALEPCSGSHNLWIDSESGSQDGDGSLKAPFGDFDQLANWITSRPSICEVIVSMAPGRYKASLITLYSSFTLQKCQVCPQDIYEMNLVEIVVSNTSLFTTATTFLRSHIKITDMHFTYDYNTSGAPQSDTSSIFTLSQAILTLNSLSFHSFSKSAPLVHLQRGCQVKANNIVAIGNTYTIESHRFGSLWGGTVFFCEPQTVLDIANSAFFNNSLVVNRPAFSTFGGGAIVAISDFSAINVTFQGNLVTTSGYSPNPRSTLVLVGGAVYLSGIYISLDGCHFVSNTATSTSGTIRTHGGGLALSRRSIQAKIHNTYFYNNSAVLGGAIGQTEDPIVPSEQLNLGWLAMTNLTFYRNRCSTRGCAVSLVPSSMLQVTLESSSFEENELNGSGCPIPSADHQVDFTGGGALAVFSDKDIYGMPFHISLNVSNSVFTNNTITDWPPCRIGGGASIALRHVDYTTFDSCQIKEHISQTAPSVVFARHFFSFTFLRLNMTRNRLNEIKHSLLASPVPTHVMDLQRSLKELFHGTPWSGEDSFAITFNDVSFLDNCGSSAIFIKDVHKMALFNVHAGETVSESSICKDRIRDVLQGLRASSLLSITSAYDVRLMNWTSSNTETKISLSYLSELSISNCHFLKHIDPDSHIASVYIKAVSHLEIEYSVFEENRGVPLEIQSTVGQIRDCLFQLNSSPFWGSGGILASNSSLNLIRTNFSSNIGQQAGALMADGSTDISHSVFQLNEATEDSGGAISAKGSKFSFQSSECTMNTARASGGCLELLGGESNENSLQALIVSSIFSGNNADERGGAISASGRAYILVFHSHFEHNTAKEQGGAIDLYGPAIDARVSGSTFLRNQVGLGVIVARMIWNAPPASSVGCNQPAQSCGTAAPSCFFEKSFSTFAPSPFQPTLSGNGGSINLELGKLNIELSSFNYSIAKGRGGALSAMGGSTRLSVETSTFFGNLAGSTGGAIMFALPHETEIDPSSMTQCYFDLSNTTISGNTALFGGAMDWNPTYSANRLCNASWSLVTFSNNNATGSGGAITTTSSNTNYFKWSEQGQAWHSIRFINNFATNSGGTFYHIYFSNSVLPPPEFCDLTTTCFLDNSEVIEPKWGPLRASSGLSIRVTGLFQSNSSNMDHTLVYPLELTTTGLSTGITASNSVPLKATPFLIRFGYKDIYGQSVEQPFPLLSYNVLTDEAVAPLSLFAASIVSPEAISVTVLARSSLYRPSSRYSPSSPNPFEKPVKIHATLSVFSDLDLASNSVGLDLDFHGCPKGYGLQPLSRVTNGNSGSFSGDPAKGSKKRGGSSSQLTANRRMYRQDVPFTSDTMYSCAPCLINSYNVNGDGNCYSCSTELGQITSMSCERSEITSRNGFWVAPLGGSNEIFVGRCLKGFCSDSQCSDGRKGILCGDCTPGTFESLYCRCSGSLCKHPTWLWNLLASFFILLVAPLLFHFLIFNWTLPFIFLLYIAQMSFIMLHPQLDWSIPIALPKLASITCGFRATPIERELFLDFYPYISVVMLCLIFMLQKIASKLGFICLLKLQRPGGFFHGKRFLLSLNAMFYALSSWSLRSVLHWVHCQDSPDGPRWTFAPSVLCDSKPFTLARALSLFMLIPLAFFPILSILAFSFQYWRKWQHTKWFTKSTFRASFWFLISSSPVWSFVETAGRIIIPISSSLIIHSDTSQATINGVTALASLGLVTVFSPFKTIIQRMTSCVSIALLAILAIMQPDIGSNPKYPLITFGVGVLVLVGLSGLFVLGSPSNSSLKDVDAASFWNNSDSEYEEDSGSDEIGASSDIALLSSSNQE